jgi:hypothetical protein
MHWQERNQQKNRQANFFAKGAHGFLPARFCAAGAGLKIGRVTRLHFIVTARKVKSGGALRAKSKNLKSLRRQRKTAEFAEDPGSV